MIEGMRRVQRTRRILFGTYPLAGGSPEALARAYRKAGTGRLRVD